MDESISFLSFSLDQVIVDSDTNGINSLEYVTEILEQTSDSNLDQTFYLVQTSEQFDIVNEIDSVSSALEISRIDDIDQSINLVNLGQLEVNPSLDDLDLQDSHNDLQTSIEEIEDTSSYFIKKEPRHETADNENRNTVIQIVGTLNDDIYVNSKEKDDDLCKLLVEEQTVEDLSPKVIVNGSTVKNKKRRKPKKESRNSDKVWTCEHCPKLSFNSKFTYDRHCWREHKPPLKNYSCTECELTFMFPSRLKAHMLNVHLHYRPYKCDICRKTFSKLADLKKHIDTHTATKHYTCPTCKKQFTETSNLKRHMLTHTTEKPYHCPVCWRQYSQLSSLKRHRRDSAAAILGSCGGIGEGMKRYRCRVCGDSFKHKKLLVDHEKIHEDNVNKISDLGRNVDALIQDILEEDMNQMKDVNIERRNITGSPLEPVYEIPVDNIVQQSIKEEIHCSSIDIPPHNYEIELINEIDRLESLTEENGDNSPNDFHIQSDFFSGSIDHTHFNNSTLNLNQYTTIPIIKDDIYGETNGMTGNDINFRNIDTTEDLLNNPKVEHTEMMAPLACEQTDTDCATIFESDVDLESSVNLATNLIQLISENNVEFVSTEDDDTFIINLNSTIDAEQLSDLLNIGIEVVENNIENEAPLEKNNDAVCIAKQVENVKVKNAPGRKKTGPKIYTCKVCIKEFNKKDNYISHMGIHDPVRSRYKCEVCHKRFSYRSTLNKHTLAFHTPAVLPVHQCDICGEKYRHQWMVKDHKDRVHGKLVPYKCLVDECGRQFHKRSDFLYHCRQHLGQRPYKCLLCGRRFLHASHHAKHRRRCATSCWRQRKSTKTAKQPDSCSIEMSKELLSDIDDLLKSKMDIHMA